MIEIGCGNGSVLQFLQDKGINIEGGYLFLEALQFCKKRTDVPLYQVNALNTPFADEQYDIIGLFDVIEHIKDDESILQEMFRICKPNGRIILTVPSNKWLWSEFDEISYHKRRYSKGEISQKLKSVGFIIERTSCYMFFLFPFFLLYRLIKNIMCRFSDNNKLTLRAEVQIIPYINTIFLSALRLEKLLIKHINLPVGTSLLVIARKVQ